MRHFVIAGVALASLAGFAYAQVGSLTIQPQNGTGFSRRVTGEGRSTYQGRADSVELGGPTRTYRGNVSVSFPDSSVRVMADHVVFDGNEMALSGNVRIVLDSPSVRP